MACSFFSGLGQDRKTDAPMYGQTDIQSTHTFMNPESRRLLFLGLQGLEIWGRESSKLHGRSSSASSHAMPSDAKVPAAGPKPNLEIEPYLS